MNDLKTFHADYFVCHISKDYNNKIDPSRWKDHPYDILISSAFVYAPCSKNELKKLADFIYQVIGENNG